jgi:hypothetical protein
MSTNWLFLWRFHCIACLWISFCILHAIIDSYFVSSNYGFRFHSYTGCLPTKPFVALSSQAPFIVSSDVPFCFTHFLTCSSIWISASLLGVFLLLLRQKLHFWFQLPSLNEFINFNPFFYYFAVHDIYLWRIVLTRWLINCLTKYLFLWNKIILGKLMYP